MIRKRIEGGRLSKRETSAIHSTDFCQFQSDFVDFMSSERILAQVHRHSDAIVDVSFERTSSLGTKEFAAMLAL